MLRKLMRNNGINVKDCENEIEPFGSISSRRNEISASLACEGEICGTSHSIHENIARRQFRCSRADILCKLCEKGNPAMTMCCGEKKSKVD